MLRFKTADYILSANKPLCVGTGTNLFAISRTEIQRGIQQLFAALAELKRTSGELNFAEKRTIQRVTEVSEHRMR